MTTISLEVDAQELWRSVFGSAPTSFGDHYVYWEYFGETDWDVIGEVEVAMYDGDSDYDSAITARLNLEDIARALSVANQQVHMDLLDFDQYDAVCADAVLQVAVLGSVVYG